MALLLASWLRVTTVRLALLFFLSAGGASAIAVHYMNAATAESRRAHDALKVDSAASALGRATRNLRQWIGRTLGKVGLSNDVASAADDVELMLKVAAREHRRAVAASALVVILSITYIASVSVAMRNRLATAQAIGAVSLLWLIVSLLAPVMSLTAHMDLPVLGEVVHRHDTKSVVGVAGSLLESADWPIGLLLLLCGVLAPLVKLTALLCSTICTTQRSRALAAALGGALAPWAMADVFTLGIVIAFFAAAPDALVSASLEPGAYFFAGHCVLAIVLAHFVRVPAGR